MAGDLFDSIVEQGAKIATQALLRKLDVTLTEKLNLPLGLNQLKGQLSVERSRLMIEQIRARMVVEVRRQAEIESRGEVQRVLAEGKILLAERRARLYDLEIAKAEVDVERQRQRLNAGFDRRSLPPGVEEPISGALDFRADPSGISGEVREEYMGWLDSLELGKVILILGKRGSGKTAFACKLGEYVFAVHQVPVWLVGIPEDVAVYLPRWMSIAQDVDQVDLGAFMIIDESGLQYMAMRYQSDANTVMRRLLMVARHRKQSVLFITQVASDVDKAVVRQADTIIFKQPTLMQSQNDRPEIRDIAGRALRVFEGMSKDDRLRSAYVHDGDFVGVLQYDLPDYWREELSFAFQNVALNDGKGPDDNKGSALAELREAELNRRVLELGRDGLGRRRIAQALGVPERRVRAALEGIDNPGEIGAEGGTA